MKTKIPVSVREQIKEAHRAIVKAVNATAFNEDEKEFAERWWADEDRRTFEIGCADFESPKATIFAIEAARHMCAGLAGDKAAIKLLKLALAEMERVRRANDSLRR